MCHIFLISLGLSGHCLLLPGSLLAKPNINVPVKTARNLLLYFYFLLVPCFLLFLFFHCIGSEKKENNSGASALARQGSSIAKEIW